MKKIFFFFFCFFSFLSWNVQAETMKHFEVLNGKLSIPFDSKVNDYTVYLIDGATKIEANYSLLKDTYQVDIQEDPEKTVYSIFEEGKVLEQYTFYKDQKESTPVFQEMSSVKSPKEVRNPHLRIYVIGGCTLIILLLFKIIVLGFKKQK